MKDPISAPVIHAIPSFKLPDPSRREVDFTESSFFAESGRCLPSPAEVRALSDDGGMVAEPRPVVFEDLNLLVKFGYCVTVTEAQCLWMLKRVFGDKVPVPELYGWRIDEQGHVFIYMELIRGRTLHDSWDDLDSDDKKALCDQLCQIIGQLRQLRHHPSDSKYIGSISRQSPQDYVLREQKPTGPFSEIKEFNDWFTGLPQARLAPSDRYEDPWREFLPDTGDIKFTHADLHRGNIIVSSSGPARVLAIVDWAQSGWYPDYWEYCKALYTCWYEDEWRRDWIDKFLFPRAQEALIFSEYTMAMGAV
ncbi:phosphotransferase family protein [Aspergillus neoniger CBS 115656]|uniref:Phosphotransferase enzyme family protein n=1 Tax=Aspergillus neoniger (strain CBS 115656) TaxID=1448310 RepID=A0A318YR29_ASPNB|nr:phosphotransferase enzyme family protein [Aspergillus neoniger CBS 115656]PYH37125.1 phosphotransferase enzyme family protein [Aspergillus neoniger CBS 115656]